MVQVRQQPLEADGSVNLDAWLGRLQTELGIQDIEPVRSACVTAQRAQQVTGSTSGWGMNYNSFFAGLEMAEILAELRLDSDSLVAAILYRAVREKKLSLDEVREVFGDQVVQLIGGVQKMAAISVVQQSEEVNLLGDTQRQIDNVRKMLVAMIEDVRVALIKLAERTCAIRAIKNASEERRQKVAREVVDIYAPLAHRLGIGHIKWELEDIAFRYLSPESYKSIATLLDERRLDREDYIARVIQLLETELRENRIEALITGRAKHIHSIWKKMKRKHIGFDQVHDIRAIRILVPDIKDCYATLGVVHSLWRHIPREFDDYIATPKSNGYRSLHTAVIGPKGKVLEVQIRTEDMHEEAEYGVCSHWLYKGSDKAGAGRGYEEKIEWLRQVLQWHDEVGDIGSLAEELQVDIESDRIYLFTPKGHVVDLVQDSTPVDFAYRVHTEIGHQCCGAKVNGRIVPLNYRLSTGEQVEVITSPHAAPSRDWLNPVLGYARSSRTRAKIQHWFKLQDKDKNAEAGQAMVERELERLGLTAKVDFDGIAPKVNYRNSEDMFAAIGAGDLRVSQVVNAVHHIEEPAQRDQLPLKLPVSAPAQKRAEYDIQVEGVGNLLSHIAGCCQPVPGDATMGYITQGRGVSVHRRDCPNLANLERNEPDRVIEVNWSGKPAHTYPVDVFISAQDRPGLLRDVTTILANEAVNVTAVDTLSINNDKIAEMRLTLAVRDLESLSKVLGKIHQLPNMLDVRRYYG